MHFGLNQLMQKSNDTAIVGTALIGDAFEALIGAIFLDKGYALTQQFILTRVIDHHIDFLPSLDDLSYKISHLPLISDITGGE